MTTTKPQNSLEFKEAPVVKLLVEDRIVTGIASVFGNIDLGNDRTWKGAFRKTIKERSGSVRHLWQHDLSAPPVAIIREMKEVGLEEFPPEFMSKNPDVTGGLQVVREYLPTQRGEEILTAVKMGAVNQMSFGYDPIKFDFEEAPDGQLIRNLREVRLWDISDVNFGMNPLTIAAKAALPYKDTGALEEGVEWSAPNLEDFTDASWEDLSDAEKKRISAHFAWAASSVPDKFGDLKLPHHTPSKTGVGKSNWHGVRAAMGALLGAQGGVDIPSEDREGVYNHLSKEYGHWDKEVPDLKFVQLSAVTQQLLLPGALKSGRVLSKRNLEKLKEALQTLSDILLSAEPPDDDGKVFTEQLLLRLQTAERDPLILSSYGGKL